MTMTAERKAGKRDDHLEGLLEQVRSELQEAEARLLTYRQNEAPLRQKVDRLRRVERELSGGELSSSDYSDTEIVDMIRKNSSKENPLSTREIATLFDGSGKGFARRLKRMAEKDRMIDGDAITGYWVAGYDHGRKQK